MTAPRPAYEPSPYVAVGLFVVVTLIFFWPHISGSAFLWEDFREFTYPNWVFAARNVASGVTPYWNPYTFNGMPFAADLQVGFYYPLNHLMFIISGETLSVWWAQFIIILHYPIAMIGMWLLARSMGLNFWGSTLAGFAYGLTGMLVVHMIHANMVEHLSWFPMIVYFFRRGLKERRLLPSLLAGIVLGVSFLSGHPQSSLYIVLFLAAFAAYEIYAAIRSREAPGRQGMQFICAAIPIIVGAGLFAVQLLQSQELADLSERSEMSYEKSLEGALGAGQLLTLVAPKYFGISSANPEATQNNPFWYVEGKNYYYWETVVYFGVVVLVLALVGLLSKRLGGPGWFLASIGLLGLLYALGDSFFVHPLLGRLPLFNTFRIPTRMAIFLSFGAALLAGAGLDRLTRGEVNSDLARRAMIAGGVVTVIGLFVATGIINGFFSPPAELAGSRGATGASALLLAGATTLVSTLVLRGRMPTTGAGGLLLLLTVVDLFIFGSGQNSSTENPDRDVYAPADAAYAGYRSSPPDRIYRVKMREGGAMLMPRNQGPYSGIMLYEGYNPLLLARRVPPVGDLTRRPNLEKAFDLLDIRYDVGLDSATGHQGLVPRATAYPHARILFDARVVGPDRSKETMGDSSIDFGKTVVLERDPGVTLTGNGTGSATIASYDAGRIVVNTESDAPGILLLSEIWYPSWRVSVDGKESDLLIANYSLRGVALPAGRHAVEFRFESDSAATGWLITLVTAVVAGGAVLIVLLRDRMSRKGRGVVEPQS